MTDYHPPSPTGAGLDWETALEGLLPALEGALHYTPTFLCYGTPERDEALTAVGRRYVEFLYDSLCEIFNGSVETSNTGLSGDPKWERAKLSYDPLHRALLLTGGLLRKDLPSHVSAHDALKQVLEEVKAAQAVVAPDQESVSAAAD